MWYKVSASAMLRALLGMYEFRQVSHRAVRVQAVKGNTGLINKLPGLNANKTGANRFIAKMRKNLARQELLLAA